MAVYEQLERQAFAEVPFPAKVEDFRQAFGAFDDFISIARDYRYAGNYQLGNVSTGKFGYFRKVEGSDQDGRSISADTKHEYHFGSLTRQIFESADFKSLPKEVRTFCVHAEELYWMSVLCLKDTLVTLQDETQIQYGRQTPELANQFIRPHDPLNIHLRFIAYELPKIAGEPLAKGHFDRSVFTAAITETEPGLQIGFKDDGSDLHPVDHRSGAAKFFAGKGWSRMPQEFHDHYPEIEPAYHLVDNTNLYKKVGSPIVRRAIVLFANPLDFATDPSPQETRPQLLTAVR
jgi:hypothetical protein